MLLGSENVRKEGTIIFHFLTFVNTSKNEGAKPFLSSSHIFFDLFPILRSCWRQSAVQFSTSDDHMHSWVYSLFRLAKLRAIKRSGEECQAHHCQYQSINIGDKFRLKNWRWRIKPSRLLPKPKAKRHTAHFAYAGTYHVHTKCFLIGSPENSDYCIKH